MQKLAGVLVLASLVPRPSALEWTCGKDSVRRKLQSITLDL
jgi:hypothetical protein